MSKLLFVDTETTGLNPQKNGVIQIAGIVEIDGTVEEEFSYDVQPFPSDEVSEKAVEVHGITVKMMSEFTPPLTVHSSLLKLMGKYIDKFTRADKFYLVGFNAQFDDRMLRGWWKKCKDKYYGSWIRWPPLDVASLAGFFYAVKGGAEKLDNFQLATVAASFNVVKSEKQHDALNDVRQTRGIFKQVVEKWEG